MAPDLAPFESLNRDAPPSALGDDDAQPSSTPMSERNDGDRDTFAALRNTALAPARDAAGRYLERDARGAAPWQSGQSGNPGGRPRGASIQGPFLRALARDAESDPDGYGKLAVEIGEALALAVRDGAWERARTILAAMERTDGPIDRKPETVAVAAPRILIVGPGQELDSAGRGVGDPY